ncbi:MAG: ferrous iron transport protein A [Candidatus Thioglobus sp.]|nr:ferrous iron transport protein A [Candidatus Thioglobus pontius]MBL6976429.1 ferrous iron transport protein A [Candidatus Thioglobus sp.]MBL6984044.1 ferrous iron transport protein A [Candidatus Thioglobus sp.]
MQVLSSLNVGQLAVIDQINVSNQKKIKLLGLGINTGASISILRNRRGDMVIAMGNARISVGKTLASLIKVREL